MRKSSIYKIGLLLIYVLCCGLFVVGQRTETAVYFSQQKSRFIFETDNDLFFQSDNYYTAGIAFSYTNRNLKHTPAQLILRSKSPAIHTFSGFGLKQRIYTPHSISDPYEIANDRPYSAYLLVTNYSVSIHPDKALRMSNEISIGMLGKSAGGKEVQTFIHEMIGSSIPVGWDRQLRNMFVLDYQFRIEKGIARGWTAKHIVPFTELQLGTLMDRVNFGVMVKMGNVNNEFERAGYEQDTKGKFIWEAVMEANFHAVIYDATLEGSLLIQDASALDRRETITRQYQMRMGFNLYYGNLSFRYMAKFNSNTFHAGGTDRYGSVSIGVAF